MDAQDRIQMLKQIPSVSKEEKRRKLKSAIMLFLATLISILFLVYAFMQKLEADRQKELAVKAMIHAENQEKLALTAQEEAEQQRRLADAARMEAIVALENCKKNKQ